MPWSGPRRCRLAISRSARRACRRARSAVTVMKARSVGSSACDAREVRLGELDWREPARAQQTAGAGDGERLSSSSVIGGVTSMAGGSRTRPLDVDRVEPLRRAAGTPGRRRPARAGRERRPAAARVPAASGVIGEEAGDAMGKPPGGLSMPRSGSPSYAAPTWWLGRWARSARANPFSSRARKHATRRPGQQRLERRVGRVARRPGPGAALVEVATRRQIDRARDLAAQQEARQLLRGVGVEHRGQQRPAVGMQGPLEDLLGRRRSRRSCRGT